MPTAHPELPLDPAERALCLLLDEFGETLASATNTFEPYRLCHYLARLSSAFTTFYDQCPVLKAPTSQTLANRLLICQTTADTLRIGMELLGIAHPSQL